MASSVHFPQVLFWLKINLFEVFWLSRSPGDGKFPLDVFEETGYESINF